MTVVVDETFDRTGLPDPLVMVATLTEQNGCIVALACALARA